MNLPSILQKALAAPRALSLPELEFLLTRESPADLSALRSAAYSLKCRHCGKSVAVRGLIEFSNQCAKDCLYCGIRKSNPALARYRLSPDEIESLARLVAAEGYSSAVIQGGEIESPANTAFISDCLRRIAPLNLGVTLSLGEQTPEVYREWRLAGAARYLLRIETSNPKLYSAIHPASHSWERRVNCLRSLRALDYQVGTGVMCCLPGQTPADLARDIAFFADLDVDMLGMGPYIPHPDTPLAASAPSIPPQTRLLAALNLISAARLYLHDVNIAATTALHALAPNGREQGVLAGANVMMPNVTSVDYRRGYQLYAGKPNLDESALAARRSLEASLAAIGESLLFNSRGDSPHYQNRSKKQLRLP